MAATIGLVRLGGFVRLQPAALTVAAVNGLRKAGQFDEIPKGLLTSSVCRVLSGDSERAVEALNEVLQIARRGPMPLYHADVILTRARLFGVGPVPAGRSDGADTSDGGNRPYPWDSSPEADLKEARRLIVEHGYGRRIPELEDAEAAFGIIPAEPGS